MAVLSIKVPLIVSVMQICHMQENMFVRRVMLLVLERREQTSSYCVSTQRKIKRSSEKKKKKKTSQLFVFNIDFLMHFSPVFHFI